MGLLFCKKEFRKKKPRPFLRVPVGTVPEVIRTPDLPLSRRSLYPAELRRHAAFFSIFYIIVEVAGKCNANSEKVRKAWFHLLYKVFNLGI